MATRYGGHTEWMMPDYTWDIPYRIEEWDLGPGAVAIVDDLADLMWYVYNNHGGGYREKGQAGSQVLPSMLDWDVVMKRFLDVIG